MKQTRKGELQMKLFLEIIMAHWVQILEVSESAMSEQVW